eukprot:CAMPEP_0115230160 /NCGR_PEP_ID=MMETSP0270-20121206/32574_1 /TAXON_ID=71861 /ORGANISM="Scrippsiella trochoidea, Strain CCMP3099" /LENGTH=213 /DNA_ID=CAMNT_0002644747 /DNA_START=327 /DNA_END=968 /DNA_ORIENTATION=-
MRLYQGEPSKVYLRDGPDLQPVGESFVTNSSFAAHGEGTGGVTLSINLPFMQAIELLSRDKVQVVLEINALAEAEISFLGMGITSAEETSRICGFELALMPEQRVGHSACADTLADLVIPDLNTTTEVADLITMSPELYDDATHRKNVAFGSLMVVSATLAASLLACGVRMGCLGHGQSLEGSKAMRDVKIAVEGGSSQRKGEDIQAADCTHV